MVVPVGCVFEHGLHLLLLNLIAFLASLGPSISTVVGRVTVLHLSFFGFIRPVRELQFGAVFLTTRRLRAYLLKPV